MEEMMIFNKAICNCNDGIRFIIESNLLTGGTSQSVNLCWKIEIHGAFLLSENEWNSKIVQAFLTQIRIFLPIFSTRRLYRKGKKNVSWKRLVNHGEILWLAWEMEAGKNVEYADYFDYANRCRLTSERAAYVPFSQFQQEMIIGRYDFTLPTVPGDPIIQDTEDVPWYGMYMSTAEVNLYLAEFKLLGANLPKTAEEYFNKGVRASVEEYDRLASLNKIPYYGTTYDYDPYEKVIDLQPGEIDKMLANPDYQLTGNVASDLEKVYVQQLIHFTLFPDDQFVTVRRSGCPKEGSNLICWENFSPLVPNDAIPRRFEVPAPSRQT